MATILAINGRRPNERPIPCTHLSFVLWKRDARGWGIPERAGDHTKCECMCVCVLVCMHLCVQRAQMSINAREGGGDVTKDCADLRAPQIFASSCAFAVSVLSV